MSERVNKQEVLENSSTEYWNTGNWNTGNWNTGKYNTGNWNTGDSNTSDFNIGDCNTGNYNLGNGNTGDCNIVDHSSNIFSTVPQKVCIFDEPTNMTMNEWRNSEAYKVIHENLKYSVYVDASVMSREEKLKYPIYKITGGYIKTFEYTEAWSNMWAKLDDTQRDIIKSIPNFNKDKFKLITGIEVE